MRSDPAFKVDARTIMVLAMLVFGCGSLFAAPIPAASLPTVENLNRQDPLFVQYSVDLSAFYSAQAQKKPLPPLMVLRYTAKKDDTLFGIAAQLNMPYSALSTLNRLSDPNAIKAGDQLLIPNQPGLFVVSNPVSLLEQIVAARSGGFTVTPQKFELTLGRELRSLEFFPGMDFTAQERLAFLASYFQPPLSNYTLSSYYGPRKDPITGQNSYHGGIDLAAPLGTPVLAAAHGTVTDTGTDSILGKFVIISHGNGYSTVYGHLSKILVLKGDELIAGSLLGEVGATGLATGPHLHFEIHHLGSAEDPLPLIKGAH